MLSLKTLIILFGSINAVVVLVSLVALADPELERTYDEDPIYDRLFWTDELVGVEGTKNLLAELLGNYRTGKSAPSNKEFAADLPELVAAGSTGFQRCNQAQLQKLESLINKDYKKLGSQSVDLYIKTKGQFQLDFCRRRSTFFQPIRATYQ